MNFTHIQRAEQAQRELEEAYAKAGSVTEESPAATTEEPSTAETKTPSSSEVVETETQNEVPASEPEPQPVLDVDYWMKKGAEKRNKELESGMHKAFEEKKALGRELDETKAKLDEIQQLKAELEALKAKTLAPSPAPTPSADIAFDPTFEEEYPDVAAQLKKVLSQALPKATAPIQSVMAEIEAIKAKELESRAEAEVKAHFMAVSAQHPDAGKFFTDEALSGAVMAWADTKAPIYADILAQPIKYRPQDVAYVLSEFKKETGVAKPVVKAKPVTGDIAIKTGTPTTPSTSTNAEYLTDNELANYDKIMSGILRIRNEEEKHQKLAELERKMTATFIRKQA